MLAGFVSPLVASDQRISCPPSQRQAPARCDILPRSLGRTVCMSQSIEHLLDRRSGPTEVIAPVLTAYLVEIAGPLVLPLLVPFSIGHLALHCRC